ncbi:RrF2 family transcriptional regulator [Paludisphaera rhizosphaerae]|uniref:RrF2 family transcriptional regulator n=1 Tax=Paludisphaera rhizosphaerae TaxID=2711216 RepID=UPI0013ECC2B8|nr:Rrf2 family transcriptional regulator [Paludisphaera rhizosphaerae]
MRISAKAEYACLALIALADRHDGDRPVPIREIADAQDIPETFLTQILISLRGAGLVVSTRGSSGGYRLARDPAEISLGDVLRVIDGEEFHERPARRSTPHSLARLWERLRASQVDILDRTSIAHLATQGRTPDWTI